MSSPVEELKHRMTYSEFLEWVDYLEWEMNEHSKLDYYLAQVAYMVVASQTSEAGLKKIKLENYLLKFDTKPALPSSVVERMTRSKAGLQAMLDMAQQDIQRKKKLDRIRKH